MIKKEEFYFDSRDGRTKIHAVRWVPEKKDMLGIVQIVHGMSEYIERYEEFARYLAERGILVTGEDHLGHGKSVGEKGKYGYFCKRDAATVLVRDVHRLKKMTQEKFPGLPYVIVGHSMGSFILRNYMCRYGTGIEGAVILGTGMISPFLLMADKMLATVQRIFLGDRHTAYLINRLAFGSYNKRVLNPQTKSDWLSRDGEKVAEYCQDAMSGFIFTVNGFYTLAELVSRIRKPKNLAAVPKDLPVLMMSGTQDPVGNYGKGVREAYNTLKEAGLTHLTLKMYEGARHELLNETNRAEVMQEIAAWTERIFREQV